jgi:hypothetical protein
MHPIVAQTSFLPGQWDFVLYGIGAVLLLVLIIIVTNFGMKLTVSQLARSFFPPGLRSIVTPTTRRSGMLL